MRGDPVSRHLIFDMDGTLVDSCGICVDILGQMLLDRGSDHVIDHAFARPYMSQGGVQMVAALLGPACGDPATELAEFRARYQETRTPRSVLFPGVAESLRRLHQLGFTLAICSNKPQNLCEKVLHDTGLADLFTVVVGGRSGLQSKPAPDLLRATLAELGVSAADCIYIGDSELDHHVAMDAAMPFLFLTYGYAEQGWMPHLGASFDCFVKMTDEIASRVTPASRAA